MMSANESWISTHWVVLSIDHNMIAFYHRLARWELELVMVLDDPRLKKFTNMPEWIHEMLELHSDFLPQVD